MFKKIMGIAKKRKGYFFIFLVLFLLTAVSIAINGYFFGELGHGLMFVFQKNLIDDALYKNDSVLGVKDYYYTYFHRLLVFPSKIFGLQNTYFLLYFLSIYLFYIAIFFLALTLFKNRMVAYLSVILLLVNKNLIASETIFSALFPRVTAFSVLLFSLYFFLNNRFLLAFTLIGLMMNIHITTASHMFLILMLYLLINIKKVVVKRIIGYGILTFVLSLPTFIWTRVYPAVSLNPPKIWWDIIGIVLPHHLDPFSWGTFAWIQALAYSLVFLFALKYKPEKEKHKKIIGIFFILIFLLGIWTFFNLVIPLAIFISSTIWISTKFAAVLVVIYSANYVFQVYKKDMYYKIAITGLAAALFLSNFKAILLFILLIMALNFKKHFVVFHSLLVSFLMLFLFSVLGSMSPNMPYVYSLKLGFLPVIIISWSILSMLIYESAKSCLKKEMTKKVIATTIVAIILIFTLTGVLLLRKQLNPPFHAVYLEMMESYQYDLKRLPPVSTFSELISRPYNIQGKKIIRPITFSAIQDLFKHPFDYLIHNMDIPNKIDVNDWREVQIWIKNNTQKNTILVTPPYKQDFRSYSERSVVGEWDDLGVANQNINIGLQILERVQDVCNSKLIGECVENKCIDLCRTNYNKFTEKDFLRLAKKHNASYVIVEKPKLLNFELVYENDKFIVYSLK